MTLRESTERVRMGAGKLALRVQSLPRFWMLGVLTVMLIGIGVLLVQSSMTQRTARDNALAEADAHSAIEALMQALVDAETGQRGYLLTLDPAYLEPYTRATREIPDKLAAVKLRMMQNGDPGVAANLAPLDDLVRSRLDLLARGVSSAQAGDQAAATDIVRSGEGKQDMDAIRRHVSALEQIQRASRDAAFDEANASSQRTVPLLLAMWLVLIALVLAGYRGEQARARAEIGAAQAEELRQLNARNELLARELAHRVRNLFGVVLSLVGLASRKPGSTAEVVGDISKRIHALSRAHNVATSEAGEEVDFAVLLRNLCEPYQTGDAGDQTVKVEGPAETVPADLVSPIALVFHELATNASKYGALSLPGGRVRISWQDAPGAAPLEIEWIETGGPVLDPARVTAPPTGGFGTRMTEAAIRQIGGTLNRAYPPEGAIIRLTIPRRA